MRATALRQDTGQAVVLLGLALTLLLAAAGLAIDAGQLYVERRREQVAADAGAFAAASELAKHWSDPGRASGARAAALSYAALNGYQDPTVTVNIPPTTGWYVGNPDYAEIIVGTDVRTAFMRILGPGFVTWRVTARAVGGITAPARPYSIMALSRTALTAFQASDSSQIEAAGAGIAVNSNAANAFSATGTAELQAQNGGFDVVGGAVTTTPNIQGPLRTGQPAGSDPLAYLPRPPLGVTYPAVNQTSGTVTLLPGVYPSIAATLSGSVVLSAGVYIITGGGVTVSGNGQIQSDSGGVLLFNACAGYPAPTGVCGAIQVSDSGRMQLQESVSQYAGLSIWQPCENTQPMSISSTGPPPPPGFHPGSLNSGEVETTGSIYLPCAPLNVTANGELEINNGQLIAATISATQNGHIEVEWDSSGTNPPRLPWVVE